MSEIRLWYIGFYIGMMEKTMETLGPFKGRYRVILGLYWSYIGIMERKWKVLWYIRVTYRDNTMDFGSMSKSCEANPRRYVLD